MAKQVYSLGESDLKRLTDQVHNGPEEYGSEMLEYDEEPCESHAELRALVPVLLPCCQNADR